MHARQHDPIFAPGGAPDPILRGEGLHRVWIAVTSTLVSVLVGGAVLLALTWPSAGPERSAAVPDHGDRIAAQVQAIAQLERDLDALRRAHALRVAAARDLAAGPAPEEVEVEAEAVAEPIVAPRPTRERRPSRPKPTGAATSQPTPPSTDARRDPIHFDGKGPLSDLE